MEFYSQEKAPQSQFLMIFIMNKSLYNAAIPTPLSLETPGKRGTIPQNPGIFIKNEDSAEQFPNF